MKRRYYPTDLTLRAMDRADVPQVAAVHLKSFKSFFLSSLGPRFLQLYYRSIVDFHQIGIVAFAENQIVAFATGIDNDIGFYQKLLRKRGLRFAYAALPPLLRDPSIICRITCRLLRALAKRSATERDGCRCVTLTSIGVLPAYQGTGAGKQLLEQFKRIVTKEGFERILLETDALYNHRVNRFYTHNGFSLRRTFFTPDGRKMHEYALDLARLTAN